MKLKEKKDRKETVKLDIEARPFLKWVGGKGQLLDLLCKKIPKNYNKYIEPFIGGGAFLFKLMPKNAVIADSNPELINCYKMIAQNVGGVITALNKHKNNKKYYYDIRKQLFEELSLIEAAARTIFLNKTCFNGLYRVNKKGEFNVPFGYYKNPNICDEVNLRAVSKYLEKVTIVRGDYKNVLSEFASPGDFVFLDPPYLPVSQYSDFKRYTKEQFYEEDHSDLAAEIKKLNSIGCHVVHTNSNHPMVHSLYKNFDIEVHSTKRNISCNGKKRLGQDVIVTTKNDSSFISIVNNPRPLESQVNKFPLTRYMGSKRKLLPNIREIFNAFPFDSGLDLFAGSGIVSYLLKTEGKRVISNDYMAMSGVNCRAMIENNLTKLKVSEAEKLLCGSTGGDKFVQKTFKGLYFTEKENKLIDDIRCNIKSFRNKYKRDIATAALIRACFKKRPRGIFTYVGERYDDGRKDLKMSFEEQFLNGVEVINKAVFDNGKENKVYRKDALSIKEKPDLVYMDPPYFTPHSDNEYVRRYHFVEGIACNWEGVDMQWETKTKKFKNYPTPFSKRISAHDAFDKLFSHFKESIIVVSYSSNSFPTLDEIVLLLNKYKKHVQVISIDYRYSVGNHGHKINNNKNAVKEYLFVGY